MIEDWRKVARQDWHCIRVMLVDSEKAPRSIGFRVEEAGPGYRTRRLRRAPAR